MFCLLVSAQLKTVVGYSLALVSWFRVYDFEGPCFTLDGKENKACGDLGVVPLSS